MDKPARNKNLQANLPQYQLYANAYKGGRFVKNPPNGTFDPAQRRLTRLPNDTYLKPLDNESIESFLSRKARAAYRNFSQEIIRVYASTLFATGNRIERDEIEAMLGPDLAGNIDLQGSDLASFVRDAFRETLIHGWVGCLVDTPTVLTDGYVSVAAALAQGIRPYVRIIMPTQLWDWARDGATGAWKYLLIDDGYYQTYDANVWRLITESDYYLINADGEVLDGGTHELASGGDGLPFELLVCDNSSGDFDDEPFGHSALRDVADINIEHFNLSSQLEDLMRKTDFPLLHAKMPPPPGKAVQGKIPLGADYVIYSESDIRWVSPDTAAIEQTTKQLDTLERQIREIAGIATRSEESTEAHSGAALRWEYSTKLSLVKLRAENCRDCETRLWRRFGRLLGKDIVATPKYPSDYATAPVPEEMANLSTLVSINAPLEIQRAQLRSIVLKQFYHRPDLQSLLRAADTWAPVDSVTG